jgi:hypothetical protein
MHRGAVAILGHRGISIDVPMAEALESGVSRMRGLVTMRRDGERMHPMALHLNADTPGPGAYLSCIEEGGRHSTTVVLQHRVPDTIASSSGGRRLSDLVEIPGMPGDISVRRVDEWPNAGTLVVLDDDYVELPAVRSA